MNRLSPLLMPVAAMCAVVATSNILVQFPFDHFGFGHVLTWGAFTYPVAFLVNDLTNRWYGPRAARKVVVAGFVIAVVLSAFLATPRIATASGSAFLLAQMLDISVFGPLRRRSWWKAPFLATLSGSVLDTLIFFSLAFSAQFALLDAIWGMPDGSLAMPVAFFGGQAPLWLSLAFGDFCVKILMGMIMLVPYGALLSIFRPAQYAPSVEPASIN
jgi:queuosine precursor transporter